MKKLILLLMLVLCFNLVYAYESDISTGEEYPNIETNQFRFENLKYEPYPVTPGNYFEIWIKLTNYGNDDMDDVRIELAEEYPFSSYDNEPIQEIGKLTNNQQIVVKFKVKVDDGAVEGVEKIKIKAYKSEWSSPAIAEFSIDIQTRSASVDIASIFTEPNRLIPGSEATININLKNTANTLMRDITVKLDLNGVPFTPLNSVNEKKVNKLSPNEDVMVSFDVIVDPDASSEPYKVPLHFTFYDGMDVLQSKNYTIGLLVDSEAELQLDIEETEIYTKGGSGNVIVSLSNIGPTDLKFVSLQLMESDDYEIIGTDRVYLGNLESDDFETAEFKISSKSSKDIPLKVLVDYKNAYNEDFNKLYDVNLPMYSGGKAVAYGLVTKNGGFFNLIFYVLLILFVYSWWKERKIQKEFGKAFKVVLVRWIKKFFRFIRPKNLKRLIKETPKKIKKFLRE